jgi:cell division protein ZapB
MSTLLELAERVERLLLRHHESQRTCVLLQQQLESLTQERDTLRARLNAARARVETLIERLPASPESGDKATAQDSIWQGDTV